MSIGTEQDYYEFLTRIQHPVFAKDFNPVTNASSPLKSVFNRIFAKEMVRFMTALGSYKVNRFAQTADATSIDRWEGEFFGYTKPTETLAQRVTELLQQRNSTVTMSLPSALAICQLVTGQTPTITRNIQAFGWVLGQSVLGFNTYLSGNNVQSAGVYVVRFSKPISSAQRVLLDEELSKIEKGGSRHIIIAPNVQWVLGKSVLGVDTNLG